MNILHCPSNNEGKMAKEKLEKAGLEFTTVYKESDSTVHFFTENNSYKGIKKIDSYVQSLAQ
ncbi:MAG: hypothetical protein QG674_294 [Patescibacteria group bacterium]|jgi:hypothetical protein|nr:hypothetical protein [Patescibacteria group bacterium]